MDEKRRINNKEVSLTNLDKVYWPREKYTKGDLLEYYAKISRYILPYMKNRPQSLLRQPNGIKDQGFFQKNVNHMPPDWVKTERIYSESNNKEINYIVGSDKAALLYMVNLGCIEINPWMSRLGNLDKPDYLVLDIDPLDVEFENVIRVARVTGEVLDEINARGYLKTSGKRGLHIYVPLGARYDYDQAKEFAQLINMAVHRRLPELTSLERSPKKREGKVYLDYLQNRKGQTLAAPYSVRPKDGAPVSTPLGWEELERKFSPEQFNIGTIFARLEKIGDIWKGMLAKKTDMRGSLKRLEKILQKTANS